MPFHRFFDMALDKLRDTGFQPARQRFALSADDQRFFSVIELNSELAQGVSLACAISSAHDKSLPYRFIAGKSYRLLR